MSSSEEYYHDEEMIASDSMWVLGEDGVFIYSVDGGKRLKDYPSVCEEVVVNEETGEISSKCSFKDALTDGHQYVLATNSQNEGVVEVYNIDSGMHVASLPTCGFPFDMDYSPLREEVWVHCWSPNNTQEEGHIDVFSTNALGVDYAQVMTGEVKVHGHGTVIIDSSFPNTAYASTLDNPTLFEIDINTRLVRNTYEMPLVSGLYRMAYSNLNKHLYVRAYVCCSCGFDGSDKGETCGKGGNKIVNVTTGPNIARNVPGVCGHSCEATPADVIGVYEWDTVSKTIIGGQQPALGLGADPFGSPKGDYIFLFGNDGGQKVQALRPSRNGELSTRIGEIDCGFSTQHPGVRGVSDVTFVQDDKNNIAVFASTLSNYIVLADMSKAGIGNTIPTKRVWLTKEGDTFITSKHGRGSRRICAWATGSNFIWCNANLNQTIHIVTLSDDGDIDNARMTNTISSVPSNILLHVHNYQNDVIAAKIAHSVTSLTAAESPNQTSSVAITGLIFALASFIISIINFIKLHSASKNRSTIQTP